MSGAQQKQLIHQLRVAHAQATACRFRARPGLVGETFLALGKSALAIGNQAMALQCFSSVRRDMKTNCHNQLPQNLRFEKAAIWYWYQQACQALLDIHSNDDSKATEIRSELEQMQRQVGHLEPFTPHPPCGLPMVGPIAATYLGRLPYLARLLEEVQNSKSDDMLAAVCAKYDYCHDIDTYLFAIDRYYNVLPILAGLAISTYEPNVQEALDALEYSKQQQMT